MGEKTTIDFNGTELEITETDDGFEVTEADDGQPDFMSDEAYDQIGDYGILDHVKLLGNYFVMDEDTDVWLLDSDGEIVEDGAQYTGTGYLTSQLESLGE